MASRLNPSEITASERDYDHKFNRPLYNNVGSENIKNQEKAGDSLWHEQPKSDRTKAFNNQRRVGPQKIKLWFLNSQRLKKSSAFLFIFGFLIAAVWYASVFAPNILLVNIKETYTNDLADATTALEIYTQILYTYKIGPGVSGQGCNDKPVLCRLTTMSNSQKAAFEKNGWLVVGEKVNPSDGRDDNDPKNDKPESRYKVYSLLPPKYTETLKDAYEKGITSFESLKSTVSSRTNSVEKQKKIGIDGDYGTNIIENANGLFGGLLKLPSGAAGSVSGCGSSLESDKLFDCMMKNKDVDGPIGLVPILYGPQLWMYSQISPKAKEQVWSVFNPRSSFFHDVRFKQRIKSKYGMTKEVTTAGNTEKAVNDSFDNSVGAIGGGIDMFSGQSDATNGTSLAALATPFNKTALKSFAGDAAGLLSSLNSGGSNDFLSKVDLGSGAGSLPNGLGEGLNQLLGGGLQSVPAIDNLKKIIDKQMPYAAKLQVAANTLALNTYSYTELMCSWYTIGLISNNALERAKASTAARFALQYLKMADAIKAGKADEAAANVLSSKLAQDKKINPLNAVSEYGGGFSASDSLTYKMTTYGDYFGGLGGFTSDGVSGDAVGSLFKNAFTLGVEGLSILLYNLSAHESLATLAPSWLQIQGNALALGQITGASSSGALAMPPIPLNTIGMDREYCLSGETLENVTKIKNTSSETTLCPEAILAMVPPGMQGALGGAAELGRRTCPPTNALDDNPIRIFYGDWRGPIQNFMWPSKLIVQAAMTPYIAGWFGVNTTIAAAATQLLYTSQATGLDANYALFSGTGELLGDMAMSRGLMPSNTADMMLYLNLGELLAKREGRDDLAMENARKNPFDPYNKHSIVGSIMRTHTPMVDKSVPLLSTISTLFSLVGGGLQTIGHPKSANAFYFSQPNLLTFSTPNEIPERQLGYAGRLSGAPCPDMLVQPDMLCNVRYSMPVEDMVRSIDVAGVIKWMTEDTHPGAYDSQINELNERIPKADVTPEFITPPVSISDTVPKTNKALDLTQQRLRVELVKNQSFVDPKTGKARPGSEYDKYLHYCVNRLDPWGKSAVMARYDDLLPRSDQKETSLNDRTSELIPYVPGKSGPGPYDKFVDMGIYAPRMAATATKSDLDWATGKKCTRMTDQPEMLSYFRAYTALCSVDGSMSGTLDCTDVDRSDGSYPNAFYLNNDILFTN